MIKKFTLIELLVVVAIIGILVSILMPSLSKAREEARRAVCLSNNSQILKAVHVYANGNKGRIPYDFRSKPGSNWMSTVTEKNNPAWGKYARIGRLLKDELITFDLMYCPSENVPSSIPWTWSREDNLPLWEKSKVSVSNYICANYMYRKGHKAPEFVTDDPDEPMISDLFFTLKGKQMQNFFHVEGFGVGYLDGTAKFLYRTNVTVSPNQNDALQWESGFFKD